ncbi:MAG: DUF6169 family protein [Flavobacterium nitrogenifigens]|uniref:DUF6169 family protein n=1 Tax=Flavobacterium nitrogenifigens TaxID=1617283 RepID=UPI002806A97E|nr:DUF6169 family protein [Flavobacterium nitrogenifigens]MDQ8014935.1 DUF6169 family protein [Flavobacterium nitrogenifigens]
MCQYIQEEGLYPLFYFTTKHGLEYFVSFHKMDFDSIFFEKLYSVDFYEANNQKFFNDPLIEITTTNIINNYFKDNPDIILNYVFDSVDFKQNFRQKLFDKWYKNTSNNEFSKVNFQYKLEHEKMIYHLSFIFKTEFYNLHEIVEEVNSLLKEFSNFK